MGMTVEPTLRFTDRVENYMKARPGYPPELVSLLERQCGLTRSATVVDVGCEGWLGRHLGRRLPLQRQHLSRVICSSRPTLT